MRTRVMEGVLAVAHSATLTDHGGPLSVDLLIDGVAADCSLTPGELARDLCVHGASTLILSERDQKVRGSKHERRMTSFLLLYSSPFFAVGVAWRIRI